MKPFFCAALVLLTFASSAQSSDTTLDIVNWNIEWFGAPQNGPADDELQQNNVAAIMQYLDADLYALCEVVDTNRLRNVVNILGNNYEYIISDYCSMADNKNSPNWANGQKLAIIYKKNIFSNISTRGMLRNSNNAYTNFASGRTPFLVGCEAEVNGIKKSIEFIIIHAKSGTTAADYNKRAEGAQELKDTLDKDFITKPFAFLGDFNDDLDQTVAITGTTESSYASIVKDSTDSTAYYSITLPLSNINQTSTLFGTDMLDHQIISSEMLKWYVPHSATVRTDVSSVVPFYGTGNTSDHFPVFTQFNLRGISNSGGTGGGGSGGGGGVILPPPAEDSSFNLLAFPNPFHSYLHITSNKPVKKLQLHMYNAAGKRVWSTEVDEINATKPLEVNLSALAKGMYYLRIDGDTIKKTFPLLKSTQ